MTVMQIMKRAKTISVRASLSYVVNYCSFLIISLIIVPCVSSLVFELSVSSISLIDIFDNTFTFPRIEAFFLILARAIILTLISISLGTPIGIWLSRTSNLRGTVLVAALLTIPFLANDAVKASEWADILQNISAACRASKLPFMSCNIFSPYGKMAPILPLSLQAIPVIISCASIGWNNTVEHIFRAQQEIASNRLQLVFLSLRLSFPYMLLGGVLAFGFLLPASAEDQYLGPGLVNNLHSLMGSLIRSGSLETNVFNFFVLAVVAIPAFLVTIYLDVTRYSRPHAGMPPSTELICLPVVAILPRRAKQPSRVLLPMPLGLCAVPILFCVVFLSWLPIILIFWRIAVVKSAIASLVVLICDPRAMDSVETSFGLGITLLLPSLIFAVIGAWCGVFRAIPRLMLIAMLLCILVPGEVIGVAFGQLMTILGIYQGSILFTALSDFALVFPYCIGIGYLGGTILSSAIVMSLVEVGSSIKNLTGKVILPVAVMGLAAATSLSFVLVATESVRISYLGAGFESLPVYFRARLDAGQIGETDQIGVLSILVILLGGCFFAVMCLLARAMIGRKAKRS